MKRYFLFFVVAGFLAACSGQKSSSNAEPQHFGKKISEAEAMAVSEVNGQLGSKDSVRIKLRGEVKACCQMKGCWMTMQTGKDEEMMVRFKDYGFFVPKNSAGMEAVVDGWAYRTLVPVDELRHYAEDAGKSKEEIEKITEPEEQITFIAEGVILKELED